VDEFRRGSVQAGGLDTVRNCLLQRTAQARYRAAFICGRVNTAVMRIIDVFYAYPLVMLRPVA
jgi:hypothetical protein